MREFFEFYSFKHVNRVFNDVTHELTQLARCVESSCLWYGMLEIYIRHISLM